MRKKGGGNEEKGGGEGMRKKGKSWEGIYVPGD